MYKLYYQPGTASMAVHWLLIELDLPHELVLVDFSKNQQKSAEYLKINPSGRVPTLEFEYQKFTEFAGICMYLVDVHAAGKLAPKVDSLKRAEYNQWMFYISNTIQPAFRNWFYPEEFGDPEYLRLLTQKKIEQIFSLCNQQLNDERLYFLGDEITAVDFLMVVMMRWSRNMPKPAEKWPNLAKLANKMKQLDSFKIVNKRENLTDWI